MTITRACVEQEALPELLSDHPVAKRMDRQLRRESLAGVDAPQCQAKTRGSNHGPNPLSSSGATITDTMNWPAERIWAGVERIKTENLEWKQVAPSVRSWWEQIEKKFRRRPEVVYWLAEELRNRQATISEFFLTWMYTTTDDIRANLIYLDYQRRVAASRSKRRR